jgi:hypothetical protein
MAVVFCLFFTCKREGHPREIFRGSRKAVMQGNCRGQAAVPFIGEEGEGTF